MASPSHGERMSRSLLAVLGLAVAAPLAAQSGIEITPTIGYRFGCTINNDDGRFSASDDLAWGATFGYRVKADGLVELVYSRQFTTIRFNPKNRKSTRGFRVRPSAGIRRRADPGRWVDRFEHAAGMAAGYRDHGRLSRPRRRKRPSTRRWTVR
jgi:hypothetical protein